MGMDEVNREELLDSINTLYGEDLLSLIGNAVFSYALIELRDKTIFFTDNMQSVIGRAALQGMSLEQFYSYIPEDIRGLYTIRYDSAVKDVITGALKSATLSHDLLDINGDRFRIEFNMKLVNIGGRNFILCVILDKNPSLSERGFAQLFGHGIESYFITYDMKRDIAYVSKKFVENFDLRSGVLEKFSTKYPEFMHEDCKTRIKEVFYDYLLHHQLPAGTIVHLLSPGRGEVYFRLEGLSDSGPDGRLGGDERYISAVFTDVTGFVLEESLRNNIIDSSSAVTFIADIKRDRIKFSENITDLFPEGPMEIEGDFVEKISDMVIPEDRKRFNNAIRSVMNEIGTRFAIEMRVVGRSGKNTWIACRGKSLRNRIDETESIVGTMFDLTQMNEMKENVEKKDASNEITGLPTRDRLMSDTSRLIRRADLLSAGIILVDINDFHAFNDRYGRSAGNEILIALAELLKETLPEKSSVYHIGTDTFAILWPDVSQKKAAEYMNNIQETVVSPLETKKGSFFVNLGISAAFYPLASTAEEMITNAEIALHKVKQNKKLKFTVYSPVDMHELKERLDFELQITQSIRNNMENFHLYYQPLVDAKTGSLLGAEALLRWQAPDGELVNPEKVVAALESTDQMESVGMWILNEAISQCAEWIGRGAPKEFYVHINATADDLVRKDYARGIRDLLNKYGLSPNNILIELTETSIMQNMSLCRKNLYDLHEYSIRTALDDFGSGYSSFNYLKELPVDEIKIDKTFVDDMEDVEFDRSFINAMTMLAHSIGKKVVVEGVETESQANAIRQMGADIFQGYFFGKPMSVFAFWNQYFS